MNQDEHKIVVRRMAGLIAAASVLIAVYVLRLIFLQLVNSDSFKAQATNTTDYNFTVTAARGGQRRTPHRGQHHQLQCGAQQAADGGRRP